MNIMARKKCLARVKEGGISVYRPSVSEEDNSQRMLSDLVTRVFDGSAAAAMLNLVKTSDLDAAELARLRETINRKLEEEARWHFSPS